MTKGFDKISHSILLLKLMQRKIPYNAIKLLQCWYDNSYKCVRWEHLLSNPYKLLSGVRQGGVLSSILFSIYIDNMLEKLKKYGVHYKGLSVSALKYADDLVLLAPSLTESQSMLDLCREELNNIDLQLNARKSNAIRIGSRYKNKCCDLCVGDVIIPWVNEAKYLGLCITSSNRFKCNFDSTKIKYYRAVRSEEHT